MGCSNSKSEVASALAAEAAAKKVQGRCVGQRRELDCTRRKQSMMLHNLVHEEFRRTIDEVYDLQTGRPLGAGSFGTVYDLQTGRPLGAGSFGTVRAVTHRSSGKEFALKTVEIKGLKDEAHFALFMNEVEIMKKLDHPSVARLQEVYHSPDYVFMVMDLYAGGDLVDRQRIRTEQDAAAVVKDIVDGIRYCHEHNIAHRDLKLENILYEHSGPDAGIKIVDFGLGTTGTQAQMMRDIVGTIFVHEREHVVERCCRWSIGIITYTLMVGRFPFMAESLQMLQHMIKTKDVDMDTEDWEVASPDCKDFIARLLVKDPSRRMTAKEAQAHPWLQLKRSRASMHFQPLSSDVAARLKSFKDQSVLKPLSSDVAARLKSFKDQSVLKRVALEIVARTLEPTQICGLEAEFRKADKEGTGELSLETFRKVMRESALLRDKDIDQIFKSLDVGCCGTVHFTGFMAAGLKWQKLDEQRLRLAFDRLDHNNCGYITLENLQFTVGSDLSDEQMREAIAEFDHDKDGKLLVLSVASAACTAHRIHAIPMSPELQIGFPEFCAGMRKSGADLGVLSTATITSRSMAAMSRMVSTQTLKRIAQGMGDPVSDDEEVYAGGDSGDMYFYEDDETDVGGVESNGNKGRRFTDAQSNERGSQSERHIHGSGSHHQQHHQEPPRANLTISAQNVHFDPALQAAANSIFMRRATSETGKDLNTSLHKKKVLHKRSASKVKREAKAKADALAAAAEAAKASREAAAHHPQVDKLPTILDETFFSSHKSPTGASGKALSPTSDTDTATVPESAA
ncbi:kinase-like domain-containing protein [Tribonema minus]|uniref:Kinase-like domain-containing protein n=1 Tax=Tribonema minus TaxID=303371 RepID=A0A835Z6S6_9STRA|nr:kinase-like domain-containing protein [Tribonema minus]